MPEVQREDFLNTYKTRNLDNTNTSDFNCGGFALGTYNWFLPYEINYSNIEHAEDLCTRGYNSSEIKKELLEDNVDFILSLFEGKIQRINSLREAAPDDNVIAFRIAVKMFEELTEMDEEEIEDCEVLDVDFHFQVRQNGEWLEKMGTSNIVECPEPTEESWDTGFFEYTEPTAYFILKN